MQLTKIKIENFRSIKKQTVMFDHNCLILVGKNEAGKSNILKAIAAVFEQYKVSDKDRRKKINNETIESYYVRADVKLEESDFDKLEERFKEKYTSTECIAFTNDKTLRDYMKFFFHEFSLQIDIGESKNINYFFKDSKDDFILKDDIYLNGNSFNVAKVGVKQDSILPLIFEEVKKLYNDNPYTCHYWEYNDRYLLPNSITIESFKADPSICLPLQNIFTLSNRENIKDEFNNAFKEDGDYENLLEQVSETVTSTFQKIWQDFKDTSIQLRHNGAEITIKIVNNTKYTCEDRSDGFKKFISILLMLSTQARSNKIGERDIILIDEPDQSLYPTSARYLRNELLRISEKGKIIYSTHSPYMIDANCIDRHLIVYKEDDVTTAVKQAGYAQYSNDELLREAIGASIFEIIRDKNIIFEGWLDKELFNKYCEFYEKTTDFVNFGKVYLGGIKEVKLLVQILILANKKFIIVADSDKTSNDKREDFKRDYEEFSKNWLAYADVVENVSTMEDFLITTYISECIEKENSEFIYDESQKAVENIQKFSQKDKEIEQKIKKELVDKVDKEKIKDDYKKFINRLKEELDNL